MTAPRRRRADETKPPARPRKAERKRQLLGHAKQLFVTLGYRDTTTAMIAGAAAVSETVLARHFESKQAFFAEVLEEVRRATLDRWDADAAGLTDPLAKLHAIADLYLESTRSHALEFRILHRTLAEGGDEETLAQLRALYLDLEARLAQIISEGQQAGVFRRSLDPRVGSWELIRTGLGYALTRPLGVPLYEEPDYVPRAVECMLHCLLKTDV